MVMLLAGGCGGQALDKTTAGPAVGKDVPWPPPAGALRQASDDIVHFAGSECTVKGGDSSFSGQTLDLQGGGALTWAIYTLGGCSAAVQPVQYDVDFSVTPQSAGDGTALWVGLGDYSHGRWEWHAADPPLFSNTPLDPAHYYSPGGTAAVAVVLVGPGQAVINEVRFHRVGATDVPIPQNLTGTAEVGIVHLDWDDVPGVDGYNVYRSLSDTFSSPEKLTSTPVPASLYDDMTVGSDITYYYKVTAVKYNESLMSNMATVHAPPDSLGIPQNLTGTANVGEIALQWDDVVDATGYNVYRATTSAFTDPVKINATPVATSDYLDSTVGYNWICYYRVSAVHLGESGLSNMVDIFAPQADLPEPQNPRASEISQTSFRVSWDWDSGIPVSSFYVFVSQIPNFSLNLIDDPEVLGTPSFGRSILWDNPPRTPETTYYFRIVAVDSATGFRGRMTDDIAVTTRGYWRWNDIEIVGQGVGPLCMVADGGDLTAAYFHGNQIDVAHRDAGTWTVEPAVLGTSDDAGGFSSYLDMAAASGHYIVASFATIPGDSWVATGAPGAWTKTRVDGDGQAPPPPGSHEVSGEYCKVAASSDEFGLLYEATTQGNLMLRTMPIASGLWSTATTMRSGVVAPLYHSMAYLNGDPYVLMMDPALHELRLGDRDGLWNWTDIANSGSEDLGDYNQLLRVGTDWWTPAVNETTGNFYTLRGNIPSWETKTVATTDQPSDVKGVNARLTQFGAEMAMVYYGYSPNTWYFGVYRNNEWDCALLKPPTGVVPGMYIDIAVLGADPYILIYDNADQKIKCLKGTPPPS